MTNNWQRLVFFVSAGVIALFSLLGIYLVQVDIPEPYSHLLKAGHGHGLCFAFAAILYALLLERVNLSSKLKKYLSYWVLLTFLGPFGLLFAGMTHKMNLLIITSVIGEGSFVLLWIMMLFLLLTRFETKENK